MAYFSVFIISGTVCFSLLRSGTDYFKDFSSLLSLKVEGHSFIGVSDENLGMWRCFVNLLACLGEVYSLFNVALVIAFPPSTHSKPLLMQMHVTGPWLCSVLVRQMCRKQQNLSYEQIQALAVLFNASAIMVRLDLPLHLLPANFMIRALIGALSSNPGQMVSMNLLSAPVIFALQWRSHNGPRLELMHAIFNESISLLLLSLVIWILSALFQKQEMATQKLQEEIAVKEKIVKETESLLGAARRLLSVTCDCLVQLSYDWKLKEPDRSVKDMLKLGSKTTAALHFAQFICPEDHDRFSSFIQTSSDSNAPSSLHLKMQDTKGCAFHVQLFHVQIPNLDTGSAGAAPKDHLLGLIRQELKEPEEDGDSAFGREGAFCPIPEGHPVSSASSRSSRVSGHTNERKDKERRRKTTESTGSGEGWPKLDAVRLTLDLNTTELGYAIRSLWVDLRENCPDFSLLKFVKRKYRAMVEDWIQEHMNCWMMQRRCDEPCLGCKLQLDGFGGVLVREMRVVSIDQIDRHEAAAASGWKDDVGYTLLMTVELQNFLAT